MEVKEPSAKYLVQPKYKQTEVGVIPVDWDAPLLDSIAKRGSGHTPNKRHPEYWGGSIKWISLRDTGALDHLYIDDTVASITPAGIANSSAVLHPTGTVVLSRDAGVGKSAVMSCPMAVSQHFIAWQCGLQLNNIYLYYSLQQSKPEFERIAMGSTIKTIGLPFFRSLRIPLPCIAEQQAISESLSDADALIESLEQLLAKKRQIKQGAMQELLTGQKRLPGFAGEWEQTSLGDVGDFLKGSGITRDEAQSGDLPCIRYGEIYTTHNDYIRAFQSWISAEVAATATRLRQGDLLFAGSGETKAEIGKCIAFLDDMEAYAGGDIVILRPRGFDSLFLGYALNTAKVNRQKASRGQGDAVVHISAAALAQVVIRTPKPEEQTAIATVLSDMDTELAALEAKLTKARALKQGMMQELLTGRIRLVSPRAEVIPFPAQTVAAPKKTKPHNRQIEEAVMLGVLAQAFASEQHPLARVRRTKLLYLLHRYIEGVAEGYLKKAAGPYNPKTRYQGAEGIAVKNGYVCAHHNGTYEGFIAGTKVAEAAAYFDKWHDPPVRAWLERFRYTKTDELELLATVDMAMEDLRHAGNPVSPEAVKRIIQSHPEWQAKLERDIFSDANIERALAECHNLFGD